MSAQYALFENPNPKKDGEKQPLHARIVQGRTIRLDRLSEEISAFSSFSPADIRGLLQAFSDQIAAHLEDGNSVELEGLGHFSVSLNCPKVMSPKQIRAEDIHFKTVNFRCSSSLKNKLKDMQVKRAANSAKDDGYTTDERMVHILRYLEEKDTLQSSECMGLNQCTRYMALKDLQYLLEKNKIVKLGHNKNVVYALKKATQKESTHD